MSAPARHLQAAPPPAVVGPALVPMMGDRAPRIEVSPGRLRSANAHRLFFGMWYLALGMFVVAAWMQRGSYVPAMVLNLIGGLFVALGGFGILVHTLWRPAEHKLRHALAAGAAFALTLASLGPLRDVSTQVFVAARVARLQPVAEALARDARIRNVGGEGSSLRINGFSGSTLSDGGWLDGDRQPATTLSAVLRRDGLTRAELQPYLDGLRAGGMTDAERTAAGVLLARDGMYDARLLYVIPGQPLPDVSHILSDETTWRSEPLGGGWFLLRRE